MQIFGIKNNIGNQNCAIFDLHFQNYSKPQNLFWPFSQWLIKPLSKKLHTGRKIRVVPLMIVHTTLQQDFDLLLIFQPIIIHWRAQYCRAMIQLVSHTCRSDRMIVRRCDRRKLDDLLLKTLVGRLRRTRPVFFRENRSQKTLLHY